MLFIPNTKKYRGNTHHVIKALSLLETWSFSRLLTNISCKSSRMILIHLLIWTEYGCKYVTDNKLINNDGYDLICRWTWKFSTTSSTFKTFFLWRSQIKYLTHHLCWKTISEVSHALIVDLIIVRTLFHTNVGNTAYLFWNFPKMSGQ